MKKKHAHGGPRTAGPGRSIGRPPTDNPKVSASLRLPADVKAYLDDTGNASQTVADVVRRSKAFRDWKRDH